MSTAPRNVLFLCTGNSARSILAEAYLNARARGRFTGYSAGSHPGGAVNPFALELLRERRIDAAGLRSKGWDEYDKPGAPAFDLVITVCDNAAGEVCPIRPDRAVRAHWGVPDPAAQQGTDEEKRRAFRHAFGELSARIDQLLSLPIDKLDRQALEQRLAQIGRPPRTRAGA